MTGDAIIDAGIATLSIRIRAYAIVAQLAGELDVSNVGTVQHALIDALRDGTPLLVLDFTDVRYIDSSTVAMVVAFASELNVKRRRLAVVAPDGQQVRRVLHYSGVAESLDVHEDQSSAVSIRSGE